VVFIVEGSLRSRPKAEVTENSKQFNQCERNTGNAVRHAK